MNNLDRQQIQALELRFDELTGEANNVLSAIASNKQQVKELLEEEKALQKELHEVTVALQQTCWAIEQIKSK